MKALVSQIIISSISTAADKGLRFRASTPELDDKEAVAFMGLRGINLRALFEPMDYPLDGKVEVRRVLDTKTPGERMRASIFVWWKQLTGAKKIDKDYNSFYLEQMERFIGMVKEQLEPDQ